MRLSLILVFLFQSGVACGQLPEIVTSSRFATTSEGRKIVEMNLMVYKIPYVSPEGLNISLGNAIVSPQERRLPFVSSVVWEEVEIVEYQRVKLKKLQAQFMAHVKRTILNVKELPPENVDKDSLKREIKTSFEESASEAFAEFLPQQIEHLKQYQFGLIFRSSPSIAMSISDLSEKLNLNKTVLEKVKRFEDEFKENAKRIRVEISNEKKRLKQDANSRVKEILSPKQIEILESLIGTEIE